MVYGVTVDVGSPWVSATDSTAIIVGDSGDTDRVFTTEDADMTETYQFQSNYMARYSSTTDIVATVTAGSASSGVATITVLVVTDSLTIKDFGSVADNGSV